MGAMSSKEDDYKRQAKHCFEQSQREGSSEMKARWLEMAQGWLSMVPMFFGRTPQEKFDALAQDKSTGQKDSDASH